MADELRHTDPRRWWPRLTRLLEEQRVLCVRLEELSREQQAQVRAGQTDGVLSVLGERQGVIDRLRALGAEMEPFRQRRAELMSRISESDRARFESLVDEIALLVERVRGRDEEDREELEKQRGGVARELTAMVRSRGAVAAYGAPAVGGVGGLGGADAHGGPAVRDRRG